MSLILDDDGAGLAKEESRASIASFGSIAHSEAPTRKSDGGSLVAVPKSSAGGGGASGEGGGLGLLRAPSLKEAIAEQPSDDITLKADRGLKTGSPSVRSSFGGGGGQALVVDLKPTPVPHTSTPLK